MKIVPFKIAQNLKEKGFSIPSGEVIGKYDSDGVYHSQLYINFTETMDSKEIIAPTISQVLKWLREEKKIYIMINFWPGGYCGEIFTEIGKDRNSFCWEKYINECDYYETYEQAALAGIEYVLDNLIQL